MPEPRIWRPHKVQEEFIRLPFTIFEALYGGAAGGGKSEVLLALPIIYRFHEHPKFHGIIFRRSYPELKESLIPRSEGFYLPFGGKYNATDHVWRFPSGARVRLSHLQDDKAARSHDTAEFNYVGFDELTAFEEFHYIFLTSRVRSSTPELPAIVRAATNPGNLGHAWVKKRFVAPAPDGRKILLDSLTNQKRIFIPAKLQDNPFLLENDPSYGDRLKILPEMERKAKLDGDWDIFAGQAFSEFRDNHFPGEPENALHVIPPPEIPHWYPRLIAIDWGQAANTFALWGAVTPDKRVIIYREYVKKFLKTSEWATEIGNISLLENIVRVVLDPSAWQNRGEEETIAQRFEKHSGFTPYPASNDRVSGKLLVHEYLRWEQKPPKLVPKEGYREDVASKVLKLRGLKGLEEYRNLFIEEPPETNLPKLLISTACPELIAIIKNCVVDEKKPNDVAEFDGDDGYDDLRYLLKLVDAFSNGLIEEAKVHAHFAKIHDDYMRTGDYMTFHHRMELFEKAHKNVPLQLGHHPKATRSPAPGLLRRVKR